MPVPRQEVTPSRLLAKPTWLISQVAVHAHRLLTQRLAATGSRGYHYRLLAALHEFGPASQATLGRRTEIDRSNVVAELNELAGRGLVERVRDAADQRRNVVAITPAGVEHYEWLDGILSGVQDELLRPLSARERRLLTDALTKVLRYHGERR
jgi:DNA-binding MarR family transcriptional regulator